jgi:hydrogenase maturation protein HypF
MAENHLAGPVIGVAFDGTGYGTDGKIWGGEFLLADYLGFERRAHLRYVELPGGDAAVRQPWRSAVSWLEAAFPSMEIPEPLDIFRRVPERERRLVTQMVRTRVNTVATSSCGRLFDAVASLTGVRHEVTFEGQAAIELEMAADPSVEDCYPFEFGEGEPAQIDMSPAIGAIVSDVAHKTNIGVISARFHNTMAEVIAEGCRLICRKEGLKRVCLSGGTFQNVYLLERAVSKLERAGFEVFLHSRVPANDGGIALGQAVIANEIVNRGA